MITFKIVSAFFLSLNLFLTGCEQKMPQQYWFMHKLLQNTASSANKKKIIRMSFRMIFCRKKWKLLYLIFSRRKYIIYANFKDVCRYWIIRGSKIKPVLFKISDNSTTHSKMFNELKGILYSPHVYKL